MKKNFILLLITFSILFSQSTLAFNKNSLINPDDLYPKVKFETSMGDIIVELDRVRAPITVENFLNYVANDEYNNTIFHRVIENFIVQGGGYTKDFVSKKLNKNIVNESGNGLKNDLGTISMAKESKPHTANRQFFFNVADNSNLDPGRSWGYAVFGSIVEGEEIIEAISKVPTDFNEEMAWNDVPVKPILLIKVTLLPAE